MENPYELVQLHFHWGSGKGFGSEHTINGKAGEAELHLGSVLNNLRDRPQEFLKMKIFVHPSVQCTLNPIDYDGQNRFTQIDALLFYLRRKRST